MSAGEPGQGAAAEADVLVVGAGPAGAVTALLLARRGVDVLLVDRAAFPRQKPCGDCLSAAATALLRRLGLLDRVCAAGASPIEHWDIIGHDGTVATGRFHGPGALALDRARLDVVLVEAAREAGARFLQARVSEPVVRNGRVAGVISRTPNGREDRLEARLLVGADGLRSVLARRLGRVRRGRLRKVSLTARLPAPPAPLRHGEMHLLPGGCLGLAPAGAGLCNLTLVLETGAASDLGRDGPAAFFRRHVRERARHLRGRTPKSALVALIGAAGREADGSPLDALDDDDLMASGPFDFPGRAPIAPGAALVGDAAGYYDPFTGQGIHQAMAGAELLVDAVAPALAAGPAEVDRALRGYARAKRRLTRPARRLQAGIEWVLSRPALARPVLGRLARAPLAMDRMIEVTGDLKRPRTLLSPGVVSSFMFPPTRRFD